MKKRKRQRNYKMRNLGIVVGLLISIGLLSFVFSKSTEKNATTEDLGSLPVTAHLYYDQDVSGKNVEEHKIKANEFFADFLLKRAVPYEKITALIKNSEDIFDVRTWREGKKVALIYRDSVVEKMIYDPSPYYYYDFDIASGEVVKFNRPVKKIISQASGIIESSMWNAIIDAGQNPGIAKTMEDAFAWSVDMYHVQKGDKFSLIFEEEIVNGQKVNYGRLISGHFISSGEDYYAFLFDTGQHEDYFDLEGRPMRKAFLKSPVKYGRISSSFNPRRFHPVLKRVKAHLGTDYAAPRGTPIQAVAAGTVTKAAFTRGNGKYVKIRHDKVYETQYLHMSKFAKGIKSGTPVKQGQTIGYVGSTGLATGPHVCFRFWKNGKQVNHLREKLPPPDPMPKELLPSYFNHRDSLKVSLDSIENVINFNGLQLSS